MKFFFNAIECFAFILPGIPGSFNVRMAILSIYFIAHYIGLQNEYKSFKNKMITYYNGRYKKH
uniref:Uncharacterized protein n=1 Tax=viral metagenome TaxID=1070528 RepID=A0A6C0I8I4_9ZZZZ